MLLLQAVSEVQASGYGNVILAGIAGISGLLGGGGWKAIQEKFRTDNLKEELEELKAENAELKKLEAQLNETTFAYKLLVERVKLFYKLETEKASIGILLKKSDTDEK